MSRRFVVIALVLVYGLSSFQGFGQEPPKPNPLELNAALVYWQAFAMMPALSEAEMKLRDDVAAGNHPLDDESRKIVLKSGEAMQYLHRASKFDHAAWGIAWEGGPYALLPHLSKARELARLAILRAHARFEDGEHEKAIEDLLAAMRLGRQVSRDGVIVLIPLLVDYAIEAQCLHALAMHLPKLDALARAELKQGLERLLKSRTLTDAMQGEKDVFWPWVMAEVQKPNPRKRLLDFAGEISEESRKAFLSLDEKELLPAARRMGEYYDRLIELVKLSPQDMDAKEREFLQQIQRNGAKDLLSLWLLPMPSPGRRAEASHLTRLALLNAGLAVLEDGEDALKDPKHKDPFGEGPFEFRDTDNGFVLTSDWKSKDENLSLTFGK